MKNINILDCTLRDGGRIIDCKFHNREIQEISNRLADANIDIIEVGFLRDDRNIDYNGNSTFFTDVDQITPFINREYGKAMYVAFVDFGMCNIDALKECDGNSIDGIRLGFTRKNYLENKEEIIRWGKLIKDRGYKLFIQGVNSLSYSDREFLEIVDVVNEIHPYSFGIVDTYGAMYMDDVDRLYGLVDHNMKDDICINFHSHNNYQLSFALAQEIIRLGRNGARNIIIDATLNGMGKVAGNLNTELIVDYLVRKHHYAYDSEAIFDMIDDYITKYRNEHQWGYSTAAMMAGIYKSHPNNVIYLTEKYRLETKDIGRILSMIDPATRQRYDYDNIERLYTEYVAANIDDQSTISKLKEEFIGRDILLLVPGNSINSNGEVIEKYISDHNPIVISVNFIFAKAKYAFFGNGKRYSREQNVQRKGIIISSNIEPIREQDMVVNYHSLINRGYKYFENSTIMALKLLKKLGPRHIAIAGFDGFSHESKDNYLDDSYQNERHVDEFDDLNREIASMFSEIVDTMYPECVFEMITPSVFANVISKIEMK